MHCSLAVIALTMTKQKDCYLSLNGSVTVAGSALHKGEEVWNPRFMGTSQRYFCLNRACHKAIKVSFSAQGAL